MADIIGAAAGTREANAGAGRLLAARAAGHEYDPDRVARFDELATYLRAIPRKPTRPSSPVGLLAVEVQNREVLTTDAFGTEHLTTA